MGILDVPALTRRAADARYNEGGLLPWPVVAGHSFAFSGVQTDVGMFSRTKHYLISSCTEVRLVFSNYYIGNGDQLPANAITLKASVEYPQGTYYEVHFPGQDANRVVTIPPGGFVVSHPIPVDLPSGSPMWVNTNVAPAAGGTVYPVGNSTGNAGAGQGEWRIANTTTDYTAALPGVANSAGTFYGPHAVIGRTVARKACVALIGDSILNGSGDAAFSSWGLVENGWGRQALNNTTPYVFLARSSTLARDFQGKLRRMSMQLVNRCTDAIEEFGINDFGGARTLAQVQADRINIWDALANRGIRVRATTTTPRATSTDSWATTANQTPNLGTYETDRTSFNDWLRDGAPINSSTRAAQAVGASGGSIVRIGATGHPLVGFYDMADVAESARNSGKWKVTGAANYATADGLHPSAAFHTLMAAQVSPTVDFP